MFEDVERQGLRWRVVRAWRPWAPALVHGFTHRHGGVSHPPFQSLNMGFHVGDDPDAVRANRARLSGALGWSSEQLVAGEQVHGRRMAVVGEADKGRGAFGADDALPGVDGLVTQEPGLLLMGYFADCVPVLLYDPVAGVVGVVHAGWRGTVANTVGAAIDAMVDVFGVRTGHLQAALGPRIGGCCYRVGEDVATAVERALGPTGTADAEPVVRQTDGIFVDLAGANALLLQRAGLRSENIFVDGTCTFCQSDRYFSHRAAGGRTGRFAAFIGLAHR